MTEPTEVARGPANQGSLAIASSFVLAGLLAALAGIVDAIGYLHLRGLFVSFMSGNSTQFAAALGQGDASGAAAVAELIALFVLGAAAGQIVAALGGRWHMTWVLIAVAVLLAIAGASAAAPEPMVIAMGALNASMDRAGNISVSLTFVTGVLVRFGRGLGNFLARRPTGWNWLKQGFPWVAMIIGGVIGSVAYGRVEETAIWVPVILAAVLATCSAAMPQPD
jgi:uncharacterized membrane protein YoaK (UPF0700 family)